MTPVTSILNLLSSMKRQTSWLNDIIFPGSASPRNVLGQWVGMTVRSYCPSGTLSATLISIERSSSFLSWEQMP